MYSYQLFFITSINVYLFPFMRDSHTIKMFNHFGDELNISCFFFFLFVHSAFLLIMLFLWAFTINVMAKSSRRFFHKSKYIFRPNTRI